MVNEVYRSVQGEGIRAGQDSIFVRFTGCNMKCALEPGPKSPGGFDCDTEFASGRRVALDELVDWIETDSGDCEWLVLTGGEPGLQIDTAMIETFHDYGFKIQVETNGSILMPEGLDFITVSPKVAEHCIRQTRANEVKYVRGFGQALPATVVTADHYWISPAFNGTTMDAKVLEWCQQLVKDNSKWKLSLQQHKLTGVR